MEKNHVGIMNNAINKLKFVGKYKYKKFSRKKNDRTNEM